MSFSLRVLNEKKILNESKLMQKKNAEYEVVLKPQELNQLLQEKLKRRFLKCSKIYNVKLLTPLNSSKLL